VPCALLIAAALAPPARAEWMERTEAIMGTRCYVELWADDAPKGNDALDAVMDEFRRIDNLMSHYKPESQLSQINAHANDQPVQVDKELFDLIKLSTHYSQITDGAFDITYASVGYLYDYRRHIHPTEEQIRLRLARGQLSDRTATRTFPPGSARVIPMDAAHDRPALDWQAHRPILASTS